MAGRFDQRKDGPKPDQQTQKETDLENEGLEKTGAEQEQNKQNQVGNAAIAALMGASVTGDGGGGGVEMELESIAGGKEAEKDGIEYGGDDDIVDGPLTALGLTSAGANPRRKRQDDPSPWDGDLADEDLPPEDRAFLAIAGAWPPPDPARERPDALDRLLQPSRAVVTRSLAPWAHALMEWAGTPAERLLARLLTRPPVALQDPEGRMLMARARTGAIGTWLALGSPALTGRDPVAAARLVHLTLELHGRRYWVDRVQDRATEIAKKQIPTAVALYQLLGGTRQETPPPPEPHPNNLLPLQRSLAYITDFHSPRALVPSFTPPPAPEPDPDLPEDALDVDAVIAQFTKEVIADPQAAAYNAAVQSAERLAASIVQTRVRLAGAALALHDLYPLLGGLLVQALQHIDQQSQEVLKLVVEVARAAKRQSVSIVGIHRGLGRVAKGVEKSRAQGINLIAALSAATVGGAPPPALPPLPPTDPELAFDAGLRPQHTGDPTLDLLVDLSTASDMGTLVAPLEAALTQALERRNARWAGIWGSLLGSCQLHLRDAEGATRTSQLLEQLGRSRANGMVIADAVLLGLEACRMQGDELAADRLRYRGGRLLHDLQQPAALTLLARWTPPPPDVV